ncbi:MAG TPA: DEAD/DEAH box helicase, partial [Acidimicrobiia bacterium]|nr:DEAD/DEAH box helicase [Acidimicrobiia bacterium]
DAPPAERRAMALTVDQSLLRELLGEPELRDLLDADALASIELDLQHLSDDRKVAGVDGVADLLMALGPLTGDGIAARSREPDAVDAVLATLEASRRIVAVTIGGSAHWAAAEDVARLRDALGVAPPVGVPEAFLEPVPDPVGDVVGRFARTHGPFIASEVATALGLPVGVVTRTLEDLEGRGRVTRGAFRPQGEGREWIDADVLRRLRRRSLAALRREVEAVDETAFARYLPAWHGVGGGGATRGRLLDTIRRLQGAAVPASILESDVLAARLDYTPELLDSVSATGDVVWIGRGPLGSRDGRVGLYLRDQVPLLAWDLTLDRPSEARHEAIRERLATRGASFFADLYEAAGGGDPQEVLDALWDLVWAGEVTNDTMAPLRAYLWGRVRRSSGRRPNLPSATAPPAGSGRWYLVDDLRRTAPSDTATAAARAEQLLERHGVAVRDAVLSEGVPGGFAGLYPVFSAMEDAGRVRRGYFVEGRGGSQFALPGALDRLRSTETDAPVVLAAADPANPFGAALPWPDHDGGRPSRTAGAYVVLVDGSLAAFVERGGRKLLTWGGATMPVASAIASLGDRRIRRMVVETIDGEPAGSTDLGRALQESGFAAGYKGLAHRRA